MQVGWIHDIPTRTSTTHDLLDCQLPHTTYDLDTLRNPPGWTLNFAHVTPLYRMDGRCLYTYNHDLTDVPSNNLSSNTLPPLCPPHSPLPGSSTKSNSLPLTFSNSSSTYTCANAYASRTGVHASTQLHTPLAYIGTYVSTHTFSPSHASA